MDMSIKEAMEAMENQKKYPKVHGTITDKQSHQDGSQENRQPGRTLPNRRPRRTMEIVYRKQGHRGNQITREHLPIRQLRAQQQSNI
jgi:hypothetical protein